MLPCLSQHDCSLCLNAVPKLEGLIANFTVTTCMPTADDKTDPLKESQWNSIHIDVDIY